MKVLLVGPFPDPIDGCSYANKILRDNLSSHQVEHEIVNTNTSVISSKQGHSFSFKKAFGFVPVYLKCFKVFSSDVMYFTPGQTLFGVLKYSPFIFLSILSGKPYIIHVHGNYLGEHYRSLTGGKKQILKYLLSKAAAGIVLSKSLVRNFEGLLPAEKVFVVENFVSKDLYNTEAEKSSDKLRIIYLSNLMTEKGILDVLDALKLLKDANVDFEATIAGSMEVGIKSEIDKRFAELDGYVKYARIITGEKKKQKLLAANVFILPTYYKMEGQPISLLEGLATGNIIVSTSHAGIPDIIGPDNGFLVSPQSPRQITDALMQINNNLPDMVGRFSKQNKRYAATRFTEDQFFQKIYEVFKVVAKK